MTRTRIVVGSLIAAAAAGALAVVSVPRLVAHPAAIPHYVDEAAAAGVSHAYTGDFDYYVGGGVAAFDCNGDAKPDLYFAGGTSPAGLFVNQSTAGGALSFAQLKSASTDLISVTGAYPLDIDGDGNTDLVVLRHDAGNVLLRGLGNCQFSPANAAWSFDGGTSSSIAFSAKWERGANWPTVAVGNYIGPQKADGTYDCEPNELFVPGTNGVSFAPPMTLSPSWCTLSVLFTDWDRSGRRDLRVTNDRHYYGEMSAGGDQLWRVARGAPANEYTTADGWKRLNIFGMGIGDYDVNSDGYPDYYLTSQADNKLQALASGPARPDYSDLALKMNATATRPYVGDTTLPSTAWHSEFQDVNNDGRVDLFVSKGNVEAQPEFAVRDPSDLMLDQPDGTFEEVGTQAGIDSFERARGAAIVDLNGDGMLDLVIVDRQSNVRVYRNLGTGTQQAPQAMGNWIGLELRESGANRNAIGAWLEVMVDGVVQQREITVGGGHASGELGPVHFGLGQATRATVRITWPDGTIGAWQPVAANATYVMQPDLDPAVDPR